MILCILVHTIIWAIWSVPMHFIIRSQFLQWRWPYIFWQGHRTHVHWGQLIGFHFNFMLLQICLERKQKLEEMAHAENIGSYMASTTSLYEMPVSWHWNVYKDPPSMEPLFHSTKSISWSSSCKLYRHVRGCNHEVPLIPAFISTNHSKVTQTSNQSLCSVHALCICLTWQLNKIKLFWPVVTCNT